LSTVWRSQSRIVDRLPRKFSMYQHFDSDLMSDFDEDGFDEYDADYAAPPASPNRSLTPAQRRWNAWIRGLQHESLRNDARGAREAFGRSIQILRGGNRGGNQFDDFDDFDAWDDTFDEFDLLEDEDFDAASPNARRQQARVEQQRRRRLAKQQRRAQRQARQNNRPRQPQPPRQPSQSPSAPARSPTLTERALIQLGRGVQTLHSPQTKANLQLAGAVLGGSSSPTAQAASQVIGALVDSLPADEFEAGDAMAQTVPTIARLTVRSVIPGVSRLSPAMQQQLTRSVTAATRMLAGRQGAQAARAIPQIVARVQRNARRHRLPVQALPQAIRRTTARVANSPNLVRRLSQTSTNRT
jgi:hypothetical protein